MSEQDLPAGLRERVLRASQDARAAGQSVPVIADIAASEALRRATDAFYGLLCTLDDDDWHRPVLRDLDVQGLVGHLIGVERDVQRCIGGDTDVFASDHVASTQPDALRQGDRSPLQTRTEWRAAMTRTLEEVHAFGNLDADVGVHGLDLSLETLLVVRAFELWTHENDIRAVVGLAPSLPDDSTLKLMSALAARAVPVGADRIGWNEPTTVHVVLTGTGGGTWDVSIGDPAASPADAIGIRIVADAAAFCRLAANRVDPADFEVDITGDPERAARVLAAVTALALD
jgi:uncharacterized protein (TIGR03083 family)